MKQTVLITGASTGIGTEMARIYASRGWQVIIMARRIERLEALKSELMSQYPGCEVHAVATDVSQPEQHMKDIEGVLQKFPQLHVAIANAGVGGVTNEWQTVWPKSFEILRVNVLGAIATLEACKEIFLKQGFGRLVGIASVASVRGLPQSSAYCASKAAFEKYLESMRLDLHFHGIDVLAIHPGFIETPMTAKNGKMPFLLKADVAAKKIVQAIDARKKRYFFPWQMAAVVTVLKYLPNSFYDFVLKLGKGRVKVFRKNHES